MHRRTAFLQVETIVNWIDSIVWGFPRKLCNSSCTSFKINRNCHQFFSVVNCEYCPCCCSAMEQCVFSCMCRGSSKCHGMMTCVLNSGIIFSFCDGEGLFFPTHYTFQILLPQIYICLEPSKCHPWEKVWDWWQVYWRSGCKFRIQTDAKRRYMLLFVTGVSLFNVMEMV